MWIAIALAASVVGCHSESTKDPSSLGAKAPPVVLLTADGLRADVVGGLGGLPGLTPNLDRFLEQADWGGRAVAASTDAVAAGLSLQTGLLPSQHGAFHHESPALAPERRTLAEALSAVGYRTVAFVGSAWLSAEQGHAAGFDTWQALGPGRDAVSFLRELPNEPIFVWIDLDVPAPPLRAYPALRSRLDALGDRVAQGDLPSRIGAAEVEAAVRQGGPLDEETRRAWLALYALNVARADVRLGELLEALDASPAAERAVVAIASAHGQQLGEASRAEPPGHLRRLWLEVPLAVRLRGSDRAGVEAESPPGILAVTRLHATLVEAVGAVAVPAAAPSLWQRSESTLSELWAPDGLHEVSWLSTAGSSKNGDAASVQVAWRGFADATPDTGEATTTWSWPASGEASLAEHDERLGGGLRRQWLAAVGDAPSKWPRLLER